MSWPVTCQPLSVLLADDSLPISSLGLGRLLGARPQPAPETHFTQPGR